VTSPDFSGFAGLYATSRPAYPDALFDHLAALAPGRGTAWDCATGNGQAALGLARRFDRVVATDVSEGQIRHAFPHERVTYRVAPAEDSGIEDAVVDLVTVAAAVHWFDLEVFYREVRRVARPGCAFAAWTYHVARVEAPFQDRLWRLYSEDLGAHFAPQTRLVDDRYATLPMPGEELPSGAFHATATWGHAEIMDFIRSWSGTQSCIEAQGDGVIEAFGRELDRWVPRGAPPVDLRFPLYLRVSRV
jgi:SAM-dependent methyltransferase